MVRSSLKKVTSSQENAESNASKSRRFGGTGIFVLGVLIFVNILSLLTSKPFVGTVQQFTGMKRTLSVSFFQTGSSTEIDEEEQAALLELHKEDDENEGAILSTLSQKHLSSGTAKSDTLRPGTKKSYSETLSDFDLETAVVILTNLCPSHPSLDMLQETMESLERLQGLSPNAPIYIMVDHFNIPVATVVTEEILENEKRLEKYVQNLYAAYEHNSNIHIVVNVQNQHIGGSTQKALDLLHPRTRYIHLVQHDFKFITDIHHTALIKTMDEERPGGNPIPMVRFNKRHNMRSHNVGCENVTRVEINGITLEPSQSWSDNNHLASVEYYQTLMKRMGFLQRPSEFPMQVHANNDCRHYGQWLYGVNGRQYAIEHLDGRLGYVSQQDRETATSTVLESGGRRGRRRRLIQNSSNTTRYTTPVIRDQKRRNLRQRLA